MASSDPHEGGHSKCKINKLFDKKADRKLLFFNWFYCLRISAGVENIENYNLFIGYFIHYFVTSDYLKPEFS